MQKRTPRRRYTKKPRTAGSVGTPPSSAAGSAQAPVAGSFEMTEEEVNNSYVPQYANIPGTRLDDVKKDHPGMSNAQGRLIVNAENARDRAKERLADKQEKLSGKQQDLWRTYLNQYTDVETEEEKAARQRREKKAQRWAAVGDAISALANMGGAMGGATPIQPSKTLSQAQAERMEHARKLRELERKNLRDKNKRDYDAMKADYDATKKEYDNAAKGVADAEKNVQEQEYRAMMLQNTDRTQDRNDNAAKLNEDKAKWQKEHNEVMEGIAQQNANTNSARAAETASYHATMAGIAQQRANQSGHGGGGRGGGDTYHSDASMYRDRGAAAISGDAAAYNKWIKGLDREQQRIYKKNPTLGYEAYGRHLSNKPKPTQKITPKKPAGGGSKPNSAAGGNKPRTAGGNGQKTASGGNGGNKGGWAAGLSRGKKK